MENEDEYLYFVNNYLNKLIRLRDLQAEGAAKYEDRMYETNIMIKMTQFFKDEYIRRHNSDDETSLNLIEHNFTTN